MTRDLFTLLHDKFGDELVELAGASYREEPRGRYTSPELPLVRPHSTEQTAAVVRFCADHEIAIIPYAGGTGLVGGQTKVDGRAIILGVDRMTKMRAIYPTENVMIVEAGAILADVQSYAKDADRLFPLSLASEGSCRIGGNLATNAGGVQVLRYGNARDLCLGVEAVMPDGSIHHGLQRLRKDNTGYDLRNLLIGSEGTLGIITAAALKLFPRPKEVATALIAVPSPADAVSLLALMQDRLGGLVSAFELMNKQGFHFLAETMPDVRSPFDTVPEWSVLLEISSGQGGEIEVRLTDSLALATDQGLVLDALIAQSDAQRASFWDVRENIPEANRRIGSISSHDISIPISEIPRFIEQTPDMLAQICDLRINCFGHVGDGNLHYNLYPSAGRNRAEYQTLVSDLQTCIYDQVDKFDGSISAEHGIGRLKVADLEKYGDPAKLAAMRAIKAAFDPKNIMNPGAVLSK